MGSPVTCRIKQFLKTHPTKYMKRRSFMIASLFGLVGISTFSFLRWIRHSGKDKVLAQPKFLSLLCNGNTIRMLGRAYLKLKPDETKDDVLLNDLLSETPRPIFLKKEDESAVESQLEKRIKQDFDTRNII